MNIFFIPSWYPSSTDPLPGIFFREHALALGKHFRDVNIGISIWGQNDDRLLLWGRQPLKSVLKLFSGQKLKPYSRSILDDKIVEYFNPAFTWSSKLLKGNFHKITRANFHNFSAFQKAFGKVDIIHAHVGYPAGYIAGLIAKEARVPYVITEQMSPFPHKNFMDKSGRLSSELRIAYENSDKNIAISNALASDMKRHQIENISIIPNLVDEEFFKAAENEKRNKSFTFFSLGRMVDQKGIDILLKAFALLKSKVKLRIGGDGPELNKYKNLAKDLNIDHHIAWLGQLKKEEALSEYQNCDAFVLPSRHESMGVVFAEAMACGKPVIGTICGGPEEFIDDSIGYLVRIEDINNLKNAMENMLDQYSKFDPVLIRSKFESHFSSRVVASKIRKVYDEVIQAY